MHYILYIGKYPGTDRRQDRLELAAGAIMGCREILGQQSADMSQQIPPRLLIPFPGTLAEPEQIDRRGADLVRNTAGQLRIAPGTVIDDVLIGFDGAYFLPRKAAVGRGILPLAIVVAQNTGSMADPLCVAR